MIATLDLNISTAPMSTHRVLQFMITHKAIPCLLVAEILGIWIEIPLKYLKLWKDGLAAWWRHQMETFPALLAFCARNSQLIGEFPSQRPVMRSFDVFFDLRLNKRLSKQSLDWWFETPSCPLWRQCNECWWKYRGECHGCGPGRACADSVPVSEMTGASSSSVKLHLDTAWRMQIYRLKTVCCSSN